MSKQFPVLNYRQIAKVAKHLGFRFERMGKGSHEIWRRNYDSRYTTIPNHGNKIIKRKTMKAIIDDFGLTVKEFNKILKEV